LSFEPFKLADLTATSEAVRTTSSRRAKLEHIAACLRRLSPAEVRLGVAYLSGEVPQGRIGIGWATVRELRHAPVADKPTLTLSDVDAALGEVAALSGAGSAAARRNRLGALFAKATEAERELLVPLLLGEVRQGALEGIMVDAVAKAAGIPADPIRRARMLAGSLAEVAAVALAEGEAGLARFSLTLFRPVHPMLAQPAADLSEALAQLGEAAIERKLDGARVQVHKSGELVRVYSRGLNEVTGSVPEVVELVSALPARELILDGEVIALDSAGKPRPFQTTMRRFGRRLEVATLRVELPLSSFFFDCLYVDGQTILDAPAADRVRALADIVPEAARVTRVVTADPAVAEDFWRDTLERGHEGLMVKSLDAPYEAGNRGASWLKVKPAHTLDLVILAAEWGSGRRRGWLSNLHLGARDPATGSFVMLGKTFKGLTDETLRWQTERLLSLEIGREAQVVHVRPELVAEIALSDVQVSSEYPGGVALRFARLKRYRLDKRSGEADTIDTVRALLREDRP
jgi:DNA ligase-1